MDAVTAAVGMFVWVLGGFAVLIVLGVGGFLWAQRAGRMRGF